MKRDYTHFLLLFTFLIFCASCDDEKNEVFEPGVFKGELPCNDCQFIETTLELNEDNSFRLEQEKVYENDKIKLADLTGDYFTKEKSSPGLTEFKTEILTLSKNDEEIRSFKILDQDRLEVLDNNLKPLDKKLKFTLNRVKK